MDGKQNHLISVFYGSLILLDRFYGWEAKWIGKIDEFEQKLIKHGITDEDFVEYEKLLKRVRSNFSKRQHCYTTAIQIPRQYAEQAIKLIRYGLENFEDDCRFRCFPNFNLCENLRAPN